MDIAAAVIIEVCDWVRYAVDGMQPLLNHTLVQIVLFLGIALNIFGLIQYMAGDK